MPSADNAKLQYEAGQTSYPMEALTNSGDAKTFTSQASQWSHRGGYEADVKPNGLATGGAVVPGVSATNDKIDVAALSCYLAGVKTSVSAAADQTVSRAATLSHRISSVTVTSAGAIAILAGTEGNSFVETRGAAGGPPYIPTDSIEVGQVRLSSGTTAVITASEIMQVPGLHQERYDLPVFDIDRSAGSITFADALPLIHTGDVPKEVHSSYAEPVYSDVPIASDFVPPENSHSVSSQQVYGKTVGSSSSTLNQGSFTALLNDGVTDPLVTLKDETLWFKFFPNKFQTQHLLCQGKLGIARQFPAADSIAASCTISAESEAIEIVS